MLDKAKIHLDVWNTAYIRGSIYIVIAALTDFLGRTEGFNPDKMAELTVFAWVRIFLYSILASAIALRAFLDSTVGKIQASKESQTQFFTVAQQQSTKV